MVARARYYTIIAAICIQLPACSVIPPAGPDPQPGGGVAGETIDRDADPALDHFIARVPRHLAHTATVARAMTHVAIGRAKARIGSEQCDAPWLITGTATGSSGPRPANTPGEPAWYYRISHQPGLEGCDDVSHDELYEALEATLPEWITLQRARVPGAEHGSITLLGPAR